jgi:hypothetical protein
MGLTPPPVPVFDPLPPVPSRTPAPAELPPPPREDATREQLLAENGHLRQIIQSLIYGRQQRLRRYQKVAQAAVQERVRAETERLEPPTAAVIRSSRWGEVTQSIDRATDLATRIQARVATAR